MRTQADQTIEKLMLTISQQAQVIKSQEEIVIVEEEVQVVKEKAVREIGVTLSKKEQNELDEMFGPEDGGAMFEIKEEVEVEEEEMLHTAQCVAEQYEAVIKLRD